MATKRWRELDPRVRQAILLVGAFEAGLKVAALIDLAQRPGRDVRGSKPSWAVALTVVNSAGLLPVAYFLRGRTARLVAEEGALVATGSTVIDDDVVLGLVDAGRR